jgi:hypothetical protein
MERAGVRKSATTFQGFPGLPACAGTSYFPCIRETDSLGWCFPRDAVGRPQFGSSIPICRLWGRWSQLRLLSEAPEPGPSGEGKVPVQIARTSCVSAISNRIETAPPAS